MEDEKEKGFRVIDKRRIGKEDAPEEKNDVPPVEKQTVEGKEPAAEKEQENRRSEKSEREAAASTDYAQARTPGSHEPDFIDIVKSFFMQALAALGMLEGEGIQPGPPNLQLAGQYIDLLAILEQKTKGNLSREEESLIREYLSQLRMVYVKLKEEMTNNP